MYLTYEEYTEYGGALEETAFEELEFEARAQIDWWTFNRLQKEDTYPEAVKRCMYKLIKLIQDKQKAMAITPVAEDGSVNASIASESNDGVSTSYNTLSARDAVDTLQNEFKNTIQMYLNGVKNSLGHRLLYRGVYPNE